MIDASIFIFSNHLLYCNIENIKSSNTITFDTTYYATNNFWKMNMYASNGNI